ncbi:nitrate/nitrite transporter [Cyanobium gracile PCC 6307]|uniref:Nitrate/nitrite transporter n=2 Tax=Cyanobium gracile TaxID=59930 RepID=K9P3C2_CYAGP|nr:nitrate/nitrite transporter [Cyanobium gracile PCC 6307]
MNQTIEHGREVLVLGRPASQGRWLLIPLGMVILLCLGSVYSWSIFRTPLEQELGISATESLLPFTFVLVFYAALMPVTGFYLPRLGTRLTTVIGGFIVGLGYILSSYATHGAGLVITYGMIGGTGIGIVYGVPILVVSRWFPDKKGLAVGLTIIGFGLSPLITAPVANHLIEAYTVRPTLRVLGVAMITLISAISFTMKLPPKDWSPQPNRSSCTPILTGSSPTNIFQCRSFYGLWICYAIGTLLGLSAIGISSSVGEELIAIQPAVAASSMALFALFNGVSRPLFGWLSDRFKPSHIAIFSYTLSLIACLLMLSAGQGDFGNYLVAFSLFWFCLGGWLAMAPTITLRFFSPDHYAQNYGIVFTAYGAGALIGTLVTGRIRDWFGNYNAVFVPLAILTVLGMVTAHGLLKRERRPTAPGTEP